MEAESCREQNRNHRTEGDGRSYGKPYSRESLDLHGPPPVRQPGYLREARGFASPPRDGFAIYRSVDTWGGVDRWQQIKDLNLRTREA